MHFVLTHFVTHLSAGSPLDYLTLTAFVFWNPELPKEGEKRGGRETDTESTLVNYQYGKE